VGTNPPHSQPPCHLWKNGLLDLTSPIPRPLLESIRQGGIVRLSQLYPSPKYTLKKPFCFSFPPENSRIKDRKSRCQYQNNLLAAHRVFLNYPCQKSYSRKIAARNNRYGRKIPAFWWLEGDFLHSLARKGKARKSRQVTTDTAGKFGCQ
jgi:hypothetical protein